MNEAVVNLLKSKPHNIRYLTRYIKLLNGYLGNKEGEKHHICPKAKDMFPEFKCLTKNPWNKIILPTKAHRLAHLLLAKAYPTILSQSYSAVKFFKPNVSSKLYESYVINKNLLHSKRMTGENNPFFGKKHKEESKKIMGLAAFDEKQKQEIVEKRVISEEGMNAMIENGKKQAHNLHTETVRLKIKQKLIDFYSNEKNKISRIEKYNKTFSENPLIKCPYCEVVSKHNGNMKRYHFDNCKKLKETF